MSATATLPDRADSWLANADHEQRNPTADVAAASPDKELRTFEHEPGQLNGKSKEWRELAEALSTPDVIVEQQRPELQALIDGAIAGTGDPDLQRKLAIGGGILDYHFFGKPGEKLPEGLLLTKNGRAPDIQFDNSCYCYDCHMEVIKALGEDKLHALISEKTLEQQLSLENIAIAERFLKTLPTYHMLKSMATAPVVETVPELSYWRQIRENAIKADVERRYGVSIEGRTGAGLPARQEYSRRVLALDLEEPPKRQGRSTKSGQDLGRQKLTTLVQESLGASSSTPISIVRDHGGRMTGREDIYVARGGHISSYPTTLANATIKMSDQLGLHSEPYTLYDSSLARSLMYQICLVALGENSTGTYNQALEKAVRNAAEELIMSRSYELKDFTRPPFALFRVQTHGARDRVLGSYERHDEYHRSLKESSSDGSVDFVPMEKLLSLERITVGRIIGKRLERAPRLLQSVGGAPLEEFSTEGAVETLSFSLNPAHFEGQPYVPGYALTSMQRNKDGQPVYGFMKDPNVDPYARATMHITEAARPRLAKEYDSIGAHILADAVRESPQLNVHELSRLIQGTTYYPLSQVKNRAKLPQAFKPTSLQDFELLINDKMLWAQCIGSAPFLALSLQVCGFADTGVVTGKVLPTGNAWHRRIKGAGHAQTYLNYNGRRYILDATGSLSSFDSLKKIAMGTYAKVRSSLSTARGLGATNQAPTASRPPVIPQSLPTVPKPDLDPIKLAAQRQEIRRNIFQSLTSTLAQVFGAPDGESLMSALSKRLDIKASLERGDPVLRTIQASRLVIDDKINGEELTGLISYLRNYRDKPDIVRERRLPQYSPDVLDLLIDFTTQIQDASRPESLRYLTYS